jgi:hypothetical protein
MEVDKAREIEPPGTARTTVDHGVTLHADVTLSAIPNRFSWRDTNGNDTGVNPMLLYVILNRRDTPILFILPTKDLLCVTVKSVRDDVTTWDSTTQAVSPDARRFAVQRAGTFRDAIHFPVDAASRPGRYRASVGICAIDDYDIAVEFEVR